MRHLILCFAIVLLCSCKTTQPEIIAPAVPTPVESKPALSNTPISINTHKVINKKATPKAPEIAQPTELWAHIADNLHLPVEQNQALKKRINWYLKQPNYLKIVSRRAEPFLYHIVKKVEQKRLPMELALLPFVESGFRPTARSSEHAVGVWQLVAATAHHFGVKSDQWYDGRQDVLASTDAALDYLSYLHKRFDGNWLHALAAYNTGEGRVKRAIKRNQKRGKSTDFWALTLPKETADYVPKLLALSYLVKHPKANFKRPKLPYKALTTSLNVTKQFDFSVMAKLSGMGAKQLHALNRGYLKNQSSPHGPHTLLLPIEQQALLKNRFFKANFAGEYIVKKNDTLYGIARHFGLPLEVLKQLNNKQNNFIGVGEKLILGEPQTLPESLTINYKISPYLEQKEQIIPTIEVDYHVKPGDNLWNISQLYGVAHSDLARWNKLSASSVLKPGTQLVLFIPQAATPKTTPAKKDLLLDLQNTLNHPR